MKVYNSKLGRLGNAIFRYFASTLFCIIYNGELTYNQSDCNVIMSDENFIGWSQHVLQNNIPQFPPNLSFIFYGYYQHDQIYLKYKHELITWILNHPNDLIYTDGNNSVSNVYNYNEKAYQVIDLLINPFPDKNYKTVLHLRLEDFINNNSVIHPECIKKVLDQIGETDICIVVNTPKIDLEHKYINYFKKYYNVVLESNTMIEDFHIMKNANVLICSCSTISWAASFLSSNLTKVFIPNYNHGRVHETFKKPIENTVLYETKNCTKEELEKFLSSNNKLDPYCSINCKKEPITKRILEYISQIENGFYIEAGGYDGVFQSNTKFLEEEYNWTGLLIEPSPKTFLDLQKNRPNNICINKCLVSSDFPFDTIKGAFDNGPMSSVNNIRNIENAKMVEVKTTTLTKLLDYYDITKIDFFSLDIEGYELEVLKGLDMSRFRPTYMLIEIYENDKETIINYLAENNYILLENITNYNIFDNPGWDRTHNDYLFKTLI